MAGSSAEAEHRAQRRITNGITGLAWMLVASVIVGTLTAIGVAYGLIDPPFGSDRCHGRPRRSPPLRHPAAAGRGAR